tara:strand:- start:179 stop:346 length:168 start_codon:yes stop_codon:yes gene_type:complete
MDIMTDIFEEDIEWSEQSTEDLTQNMFDFITDYVRDSSVRCDMFDILQELENRIK